jgi:hypothetical protein
VIQHLANRNPLIDIPIQHQPNQIDALFAHDIRHAQVVIHNLIDTVEGVLFVDDSVEQDAKSPDVLLLAAVGLAGEDFRGSVICSRMSVSEQI